MICGKLCEGVGCCLAAFMLVNPSASDLRRVESMSLRMCVLLGTCFSAVRKYLAALQTMMPMISAAATHAVAVVVVRVVPAANRL